MRASFSGKVCGGLFLLFLLGSCASSVTLQRQYVEARKPLSRCDFAGAAKVIEEHKHTSYKEKDRVLFYLDTGMLYHYAGEYGKSNAALDAAERGIQELYTKSIGRMLSSGLLNDNALAYAGEDYEDLYLNVFKSLNYIGLSLYEDALVEVRKVQLKLNLLEDKYRQAVTEYNSSEDAGGQLPLPESPFYNDVLARYISCLLYRLENSPDDLRIEYGKLLQAFREQPSLYDFPPPPLFHDAMETGMAHLSVLAFSGLSPLKRPETFYLTTVENGVILNTAKQDEDFVKDFGDFTMLPIPGVSEGYHFKLEYPVMEKQGSRVDRMILSLGDESFEIPLIEDMQSICYDIFLRKQPLVLGKTIIRLVLKGVSKEAGKAAVNDAVENGLLGFFLGLVMDVAVDLTENADLRISHYFPAFAHAIDLTLPAGRYPLCIEYYGRGRLLFRDDRGMVELQEDRLNLFESFFLE